MTMVAAGVGMLSGYIRAIRESGRYSADVPLRRGYRHGRSLLRGGQQSPFIYPIFIAITAVARLIVLQGKEMAPVNIVFEAGAILLLSIAALIITRATRP